MPIHRSDYEAFEDASVKHRRLLRQEALIVEATEALAEALEASGINQSELARRLDKTKGYISQLLGGGRNLTLRTLADLADALECLVEFRLQPQRQVVSMLRDWPDATETSVLDEAISAQGTTVPRIYPIEQMGELAA